MYTRLAETLGCVRRVRVKDPFDRTISRRKLLQGALLASGALLVGLEKCSGQQSTPDQTSFNIEEPFRHGRKLGIVEFAGEAPVRMGKAFGAELDRRLYTDLSALTPRNAITPADDFYIRTGVSQLLGEAELSSLKIGGLVRQRSEMIFTGLVKQARPMGAHLMECAGNVRAAHFGLMSAAEWTGLPIAPIIESAGPTSSANRVLVSGFDRYATPSATSTPGASWIFTLAELKSAGAFLATEMNGKPLTKDHGAPVRLVVPGWYGCACIKWVNEISMVGDDAVATSQMQEYASRTMQKGVPQLARDYQPAVIDLAALPIRIEKWTVDAKIVYRVVGILWGGRRAPDRLEIRFNPEEDYVPVGSFEPRHTGSWTFWTYAWRPPKTGSYMVRLRVTANSEQTRRMDVGYYLRTVEITEI